MRIIRHWGSAAALAAAALACPGGAAAPAGTDEDFSAQLERMMLHQSAISGTPLDQAVRDAAAYPLGSLQNPVRAEGPPGERAYLNRLRCNDGKAPGFERQGSGGGAPYGNVIDFYAVQCAGADAVQVVIDMYHAGHQEEQPVPGFTIVPPVRKGRN